MMDPRPEGVYCRWEKYPQPDLGYSGRLLIIERVNGDGSVTKFSCTPDEAKKIWQFIGGLTPLPNQDAPLSLERDRAEAKPPEDAPGE